MTWDRGGESQQDQQDDARARSDRHTHQVVLDVRRLQREEVPEERHVQRQNEAARHRGQQRKLPPNQRARYEKQHEPRHEEKRDRGGCAVPDQR